VSLILTEEFEVLEDIYGMEEDEETFMYMAYTDYRTKTLMKNFLNQSDWANKRILRTYINYLKYWVIDRKDDLRHKNIMSEPLVNRYKKEIADARYHQAYWLARLRKIGRDIPYSAISSQ
jgi:hypothetical protein